MFNEPFVSRLVFRRAACYHKLNDAERSAHELKLCRDLIQQTTGLDRKKIDSFCKEMDHLSEQVTLLTKQKQADEHTLSYKDLDDLLERSPAPTESIAARLNAPADEHRPDDFCPPSPPSPPRQTVIIEQSKSLWNGPHEYVPCASSRLRVTHSKDKGRHVVATQDIPIDALIFNERPYACLLLPKFAYTYCDHW